jgi:glycosyltransferase involved in cell wall biosynthesis
VAESRRGLSVRPLVVDLGRDYRGGQHQALLLLQGLRARGHVPELITVQDSLLARRAKDAGISVHAVPPGRRRLAASLKIRRLLLLRMPRVCVVHANEPHALSSAWLARAHRTVAVVASRRIALPLSPSSFSLARYRAAARIIAVSHFVGKSVAQSGLPPSSIEVIYDGVEIPAAISRVDRERARGRFAIPQESVCLANVAAFVPEKGQALLISALADLRAQFPHCFLLLPGEGPERANLQDLVWRLRLEGIVKFAGFMPDVESVFAAADLFVFPSHEEPLGSSLLSAMAHGLPVVAFARGGIPEVVEHGGNGLLVKDLAHGALAKAIAGLLSNPAEATRLGKAARETISSRFSADRMVDATLRLYEDIVRERESANGRHEDATGDR